MTRRLLLAGVLLLGSTTSAIAAAPPNHGVGTAVLMTQYRGGQATTPPASAAPAHLAGFHTTSGLYCQFGMSPPTDQTPLGEGTVICVYVHEQTRPGCALRRYTISTGSLTGRRVSVTNCPKAPPDFNRAVVDNLLRPGHAAASSDNAVTCNATGRILGLGVICSDAYQGGGFDLIPQGPRLAAHGWLN